MTRHGTVARVRGFPIQSRKVSEREDLRLVGKTQFELRQGFVERQELVGIGRPDFEIDEGLSLPAAAAFGGGGCACPVDKNVADGLARGPEEVATVLPGLALVGEHSGPGLMHECRRLKSLRAEARAL